MSQALDALDVEPGEGNISLEERAAQYIGGEVVDRLVSDPRNRYADLEAYMRPLRPYRLIRKSSEWQRLFEQYRHGSSEAQREARDELVYRNIKLVLWIALKHTGRGLPLLDLMQEGVIGLMKAIEKFEFERGLHFATYATWWIRQVMRRAIDDYNLIAPYRLPVHTYEKVRLVSRCLLTFWQKTGRWPNNYELLCEVKKTGGQKAAEMQLKGIREVRRIVETGPHVSLDEREENEQGQSRETLRDRLSDPKAKTETIVEARRLLPRYDAALRRVEEAISTLEPRQAMILRLRFGLGEFDPMTFEEIGERYEVTRERIRQIESVALERLGQAGIKIDANKLAHLIHVRDELMRIVGAV